MKIAFDQEILDTKGNPIKISPTANLTLQSVSENALLATDDKASAEEKMKRFRLAMKCVGQAELSVEEVSAVKKRIGESVSSPLVVGRCWEILDK